MSKTDRYYWLEDTYHPNHKCLARIAGALEPQVKVMHRVGGFDIVLECKPQAITRKSGLVSMEMEYLKILQDILYTLLEITGAGTVTINEQTIKINAGAPWVRNLVHCETMNAWTESEKANA